MMVYPQNVVYYYLQLWQSIKSYSLLTNTPCTIPIIQLYHAHARNSINQIEITRRPVKRNNNVHQLLSFISSACVYKSIHICHLAYFSFMGAYYQVSQVNGMLIVIYYRACRSLISQYHIYVSVKYGQKWIPYINLHSFLGCGGKQPREGNSFVLSSCGFTLTQLHNFLQPKMSAAHHVFAGTYLYTVACISYIL